MYIVIYKDGNQRELPIVREEFDQAIILPGEKYIIRWSQKHTSGQNEKYELYGTNGLWDVTENKMELISHGDYTLINIVGSLSSPHYDFFFRNEQTKNVEQIHIPVNTFPKALTIAIREIIFASKFDSREQYKADTSYKQENERLRAEIAKLSKRIEELEK